jgi:lipopolysaccharide assembly outer membrane protein LptD (OstA)
MATAAGILEKCNNCNLMDETEKVKLSFCSRCQLVLYCSQECPKQAWKSQKKICRIVSKLPLVNLATLKLNTYEPLYFNSALGYASKHMSGLRHVDLIFHQHHVLKNQQDYYMVPSEDNKKIKLKADNLVSFLQSKNGTLESLEWYMDDRCWGYTRHMTDFPSMVSKC